MCCDFESTPDTEATWFVDPPYAVAGKSYKVRFTDYPRLAEWCKGREGQVIVCENEGADWLPFTPLTDAKAFAGRGRLGVSGEVAWVI
jgi:hypothetical protein